MNFCAELEINVKGMFLFTVMWVFNLLIVRPVHSEEALQPRFIGQLKKAKQEVEEQKLLRLNESYISKRFSESLEERFKENPNLFLELNNAISDELDWWGKIYVTDGQRLTAIDKALSSTAVQSAFKDLSKQLNQFYNQFVEESRIENEKFILRVFNDNSLEQISSMVLRNEFERQKLYFDQNSIELEETQKSGKIAAGGLLTGGAIFVARKLIPPVTKGVVDRVRAALMARLGAAMNPVATVAVIVGVGTFGWDVVSFLNENSASSLAKSLVEQIKTNIIRSATEISEENRTFFNWTITLLDERLYARAFQELDSRGNNHLGHITHSPDIKAFREQPSGDYEDDLRQIAVVFGQHLWQEKLFDKKEFVSKSGGLASAQAIFSRHGEDLFHSVVKNRLWNSYNYIVQNFFDRLMYREFALTHIARATQQGTYPNQSVIEDFIRHRKPYHDSEFPLLEFLCSNELQFNWSASEDLIRYLNEGLGALKAMTRVDKMLVQEQLEILLANKDSRDAMTSGVLPLDYSFKLLANLGSGKYFELLNYREVETQNIHKDLQILFDKVGVDRTCDFIRRASPRVVYYLVNEKNIDYERLVDIFSRTIARKDLNLDEDYLRMVLKVVRNSTPPHHRVSHEYIMNLLIYLDGTLDEWRVSKYLTVIPGYEKLVIYILTEFNSPLIIDCMLIVGLLFLIVVVSILTGLYKSIISIPGMFFNFLSRRNQQVELSPSAPVVKNEGVEIFVPDASNRLRVDVKKDVEKDISGEQSGGNQ